MWIDQTPDLYRCHRFPGEIISQAVWLYYTFSLSFRDVELLLAKRGVAVSYESIRRWCLEFGRRFALKLRSQRPQSGDTWHSSASVFEEIKLCDECQPVTRSKAARPFNLTFRWRLRWALRTMFQPGRSLSLDPAGLASRPWGRGGSPRGGVG